MLHIGLLQILKKAHGGDKIDTVYTDDSIGGTGLTADPLTLRPLFERRGAVYNTETGYYELNGLTDITTVQMMDIYNVSSDWGKSSVFSRQVCI